MDGNPYARMIAVIRGENGERSSTGETPAAGLGASPCKMRLGRVTQRAPLKISVAGIEQPAEALRINERLTSGAKWLELITGPGGEAIYTEAQQMEIDLERGDQVLMLTEDDQVFYIVMKVVAAV